MAFRVEKGPTLDWPSAIKKFRRRAGLKQQALAEMLGCNQTAVSHWERGVDRPSLAFQRRLLEMIARDQRAMEDLRLFTTIERSSSLQVIFDNDLRILTCSNSFWNLVSHLYAKSPLNKSVDFDPDMIRKFGEEGNKQLMLEAFDSADGTVVLELEMPVGGEEGNRVMRIRGFATPVILSDSTIALRVEVEPTDGDIDAPIKSKFVGIDDLKDE